MTKHRPIAERCKAIILEHGRISAQALAHLTGKRSSNIDTALQPDIAAGVIRSSKQLEACGKRRRWVLIYEHSDGKPRQAELAVTPAPTSVRNAKPKSPQDSGMRPCLGGCGQEFWSSDAGNRICPKCRDKAGRFSAAAVFDTPAVVRYR